jgi:hypothetical protein
VGLTVCGDKWGGVAARVVAPRPARVGAGEPWALATPRRSYHSVAVTARLGRGRGTPTGPPTNSSERGTPARVGWRLVPRRTAITRAALLGRESNVDVAGGAATQCGRWFFGLGVSDAPRRQVLVPCFDTYNVSQPWAKKSGSPRLLRP